MMIKVNLKGGFKTVQEGERVLEITDAKFTPSGAPEKLILSMKDVEDGATLQSTYNIKNEKGAWAMGVMLSIALGLEDGDEFNTNDVKNLIGVKLLCEVAHSEYNGRNYANIKKVISRVENEVASNDNIDFDAIDKTLYGSRSILDDTDDLD